ncbi:UNVERIFIED_CONTAM: hypothetical protein Q9R58_28090 [Methylobacteriaceae bacterium AG10]|nr:hypothetical protein [Methylobacteriaceae bacterium AG10]
MSRLDLTPEFDSLAQDVIALRALTEICDSLGGDLLVSASVEMTLAEARAHGYRPIFLTESDYRSFHFLLGHIRDIAERADGRLSALEELATKYERRAA